MNNDEEIKVALTADPSELEAGMEAGAEAVSTGAQTMAEAIAESAATMASAQQQMIETTAAEAAAFNAAVTGKNEALIKLNAAFAGNLTTAEGVAGAESALDQAMATGALTAAEYSGYIQTLNAAELEAAASAEAATVAVTENTAALVVNGGVAREVGVLIGELARGNYTRLEGSSTTLANRTGLLAKAFSPLGLAVLATAAAAGTMLDAFIKGAEESERLRASILSTGDAAGQSYGQLDELSRSLRSQTSTATEADEAILDLTKSGHIFGNSMRDAAQASLDMATLTGQSIDQAVTAVDRIAQDPVKALKALNEQYHFLSEPEAEEIARLVSMGQTSEAAAAGIRDLAQAEAARVTKLQESAGYIENVAERWKSGASNIWHSMLDWGKPGTLQQELDQNTSELNEFIEHAQERFSQVDGHVKFNSDGYAPAEAQQINELIAKREALLQQITAEQAKQQAQSTAQAATQQQVDKTLGGKTGAGELESDLHKQEAEQQISYDKRAEFEIEYWGGILQTAKQGSAEYTEAWSKVQELQKSLDSEQLEAYKKGQEEASAASKKSAQEQLTALGEVRDATLKDSQQRISADAAVVSAAGRLYGQQSSQYKHALDQQQNDQLSFNQRVLQSDVQLLDQKKAEYDRDNANKVLAAQQQLAAGSITAAQLAAIEKELVSEKMVADVAFVTAQKTLYAAAGASEVQQVQAASAEIVKIQQEAAGQLTKIQTDSIKSGEKDWNGYATAIANSTKSAFTGMLFQGETFKQGMASIGESIAGTFIDKTVDNMLKHFIDGQQGMTAAADAGNTARSAAQASAAATSKALQDAINGSEIQADAATGAAGAYKAVVGIPIVGPVLAPIAAGVAYGGIMAYKSIASAAGGWGDVDSDQLAMVHKREMILPASIAEGVRNMTSGGGGQQGQETTVHNHYWTATDGPSVKRFILNNADVISQAVNQKTRNMAQFRR